MKPLYLQAIAVAAALTAAVAAAQQPSASVYHPVEQAVAMMDDMDEMGGMKNMAPMKKKEMDRRSGSGAPSMQGGGAPMAPAGAADAPAMKRGGDDSTGMDMMGRVRQPMQSRGMAGMADSSLPGFPGASHLYHVGASGFFLDHPQHITLTAAQQTALNQAREKSALEQATFTRSIEQAEQELWTLTAADSPDLARIDAKVRSIEKLRADQRLAFIKAVGEAGKALTQEQRMALLGVQAPAPRAGSAPAPAASGAPAAGAVPAQASPMKLH